jgi:predicted helicase
MVILGNPPYSVSSQNASVEVGSDGKKHKTWIGTLLDGYKKDLNEKKLNLDDDYIKFIRFAHYLIEKNGQGVIGMITNNSFLDGITHRRMRQYLLETFDHIYVINLHGNSKRKEVAPDGGKDENVFDIQQGVGITLFVKTGSKKKLGQVHYMDLYGKREAKYEWLEKHDVRNTKWNELGISEPNFFFVPKDFALQDEYEKGLRLSDLFPTWNSGVKTDRDPLFIDMDRQVLSERIQVLLSNKYDDQFRHEYRVEDSGSYKLTKKIHGTIFSEERLAPIQYRIFDIRWTYYDPKIISRPAQKSMKHMIKNNIGILFKRQAKESSNYSNFFVSNCLTIDGLFAIDPLGREVLAPLYLYADSLTIEGGQSVPNLEMKLLQPVLDTLKLDWLATGNSNGSNSCGPEDILDYIYAVLHSPMYRDRYKDFLKIDFPRVPFTRDVKLFWKLVSLGREIRSLHLLESPKLDELITKFPIAGSNEVEKIRFENDKVWINATQYFDGVSAVAWNFFIGGYQPAQKWLKDRKGRELTSDDLLHWQRMIVALQETDRLMKQIGKTIEKWPII